MPLGPDPDSAAAVRARLDAVGPVVDRLEEDLLGCLVVTGEPEAQRVLDGWVDQVVDTARALAEHAAGTAAALDRHAPRGPSAADVSPAGRDALHPGRRSTP